jgi:hypothetical protein
MDENILSEWYQIKSEMKVLQEKEKLIIQKIRDTMYTKNTDIIISNEYIVKHENKGTHILNPLALLRLIKR